MKHKLPLTLALLGLSLSVSTWVRADDHEGRGGEERGDHGRPVPSRPNPPHFTAHPPGPHPHGPIVRPHPLRILQPRVIGYGGHEWTHWEHPEFARPAYYWNWGLVHNVTCISEDSYGDQYPVTEGTFAGFGLANMTAVEDDSLDRCYKESGGDPTCYLATCSHF